MYKILKKEIKNAICENLFIHFKLFLEIKIPPKIIKPPPATVETVKGSWKNIIPTIEAKKR